MSSPPQAPLAEKDSVTSDGHLAALSHPSPLTSALEPTPDLPLYSEDPAHNVGPNLSKPHKYALLALLSLSNFIDVFSFYALLPGLDPMAKDLGMSTALGEWYLSAVAAGMTTTGLLGGRPSDVFGAKEVFLSGFLILLVFFIVAGLTHSATLMLVCRGVFGGATGICIPASLKILVYIFPDPKEQASGLAIFAGSISIGVVLGAPIGALLTAVSWRWPFIFIAALCAPLILMGLFIPRTPKHKPRPGFDIIGMILITGGLLSLVYGVISASVHVSWVHVDVLLPLCLSAVLFPLFFFWESRITNDKDALIPSMTWKVKNFPLFCLMATSPYVVYNSVFFADMRYWADKYHWSAMGIAVRLLPLGGSGLAMGIYAALKPNHFNPKYMMLPGLVICTVALVLSSFQDTAGRYWAFEFPAFILVPVGVTTVSVACYVGMLQACPPSMAGVVGALQNTSLQMGVAVIMSLNSLVQSSVDAKQPADSFGSIAWADRFVACYVAGLAIMFAICYGSPKTVAL